MASRKALGRGLSALIGPQTERSPEMEQSSAPLFVSISRIAPNPAQPRKRFAPEELSSLAASIREQGVLQPLVVRQRGQGYDLIIGERRWRAAQIAGLQEVPVVILDATDRQMLEMALVENVQRADLNPIELAEAFRVLVKDEGMTHEDLGRRVGIDRSTVSNYLRLMELEPTIQRDLVEGRISMGHAKALLQAPESQRCAIRDEIVRSALSVRAAEELARRATGSAAHMPRPGPRRDLHMVDLEDRLRRELQTKVRVVGRPGRGRIELHYYRQEDLDRLSELLLGGL